jgi:hypothetical protein
MINFKWWQGVLDTFKQVDKATPEKPCISVTPGSVKLPDWSVGLPAGEHHYILPYKDHYSEEDWEFLVKKPHYINKHLTIETGTVIDGITMYCTVFKTKEFKQVGMLPEQLYPGGGEDYWYNALSNMSGYRCVGSTSSWVFHHWSKSFASIQEQEEIKNLIDTNLSHNNNSEDWGVGFDLWGYKCPQCGTAMKVTEYPEATCPKHPEETYQIPESQIVPL